MRLIFLIIGLLVSFFTKGQQITKVYEYVMLEEAFSSINETWPQVFNTENLAITQANKYELRRLNTNSGNFFFPKIKPLINFSITTSLSFDKSANKNSSLGILMLGQEDGKGGVLIEINKQKSFRISKLNGDKFYYTNNNLDNGWVKESKIIKTSKNILKIKAFNRTYDLFINDKFVFTFTEIEYDKGTFALFIGPLSHGYCNSFVLRTDPPISFGEENTGIEKLEAQIIALKRESNSKNQEIDRLKAMQLNEKDNKDEINKLSEINKQLNNSIDLINKQADSLEDLIEGYKNFKNTIINGQDGEAVQTLSSKLEENRELFERNKIKFDSLYDLDKAQKDQIKRLSIINEDLNIKDSLNLDELIYLRKQINWIIKNCNKDSFNFLDSINGTGFSPSLHFFNYNATALFYGSAIKLGCLDRNKNKI